MKRILAIVLSISIIMSMFSPVAYAADEETMVDTVPIETVEITTPQERPATKTVKPTDKHDQIDSSIKQVEIHVTDTVANDAIAIIDKVIRVKGKDRYDTSFAIANATKEKMGVDKFNTIIIASGTNFADALAGSYLAAVKSAPILMTNGSNNEYLKAYISANLVQGGTVYILGGTAAVPQSTEDMMAGFNVKRLKGKTRYDTNIEILKEAGVANQDILVATGTNFADSLSASAVGKPILLVDGKGSLSQAQKNYLNSLSTDNLYILGGTGAVGANYESELSKYGKVERIKGTGRHETSVEIAKKFFTNPQTAVVADAWNFPDGLCGGPLANTMNAPLILTKSGSYSAAKGYMQANGINSGAVLGGTARIDDATAKDIFDADEIVIYETQTNINCVHDWKNATCTNVKYCTLCLTKFPDSKPLGHSYRQGYCVRCGEADPNYQPEITANKSKVVLSNERDVVYITLTGADTLIYDIDNENIVSCVWGEWVGDTISLSFYPLSNGQTTVTVYIEGYEKSITIPVSVSGKEISKVRIQKMAALGIDTAYYSARFPSTLHLRSVTYEDIVNGHGDLITRMVLSCYAANSLGGYGEMYVVVLCSGYETDYLNYEWDGLYFSTSTHSKDPGLGVHIMSNVDAMSAYKKLISNPKDIPYD